VTGGLAIAEVGPQDVDALAGFFALYAARPDLVAHFHPHPFTPAEAERIALRPRRDRYTLARWDGRVVGYSCLRGWDEGFTVPSFGFGVHPELPRAGIGRALLLRAIDESRAAGATRLRATVEVVNGPSRALLERAGFVFAPRDERSLVGFLDLAARPPDRPVDAARLAAWARGQPAPGGPAPS
jgi:ribosomal-protein-alanine N-acetyltransferase